MPEEERCGSCGEIIVEFAKLWHGQPFCENCEALLNKQESVKKEDAPVCDRCDKSIAPLSAVRIKDGIIRCDKCVAALDAVKDSGEIQNAHLAAIAKSLAEIRTDTQRIASIMTFWFVLGLVAGTVWAVIVLAVLIKIAFHRP